MFYCESCRYQRKWPDSVIFSLGQCEICGRLTSCYDRASSTLPEPPADFRVMVPSLSMPPVSYPGRGCNLYTRQEAIRVMRELYSKFQWVPGSALEPWAENDRERFTLQVSLAPIPNPS